MSDPKLFLDLFWEDINYIEIGEFSDETAFQRFLDLIRHKEISYGVHSPLFRNGSKYDLIQKVHMEPDAAWVQLEFEAERLSLLGARYILVHFPYFMNEVEANPNELIENGLKKLGYIQHKYKIPFICEPKLGAGRSPVGIQYLHDFPIEKWNEYGMKIYIDIGDYLVATGDNIITYLEKWKKHIQIVHLHNVLYNGDKYIWIPVHPSQEHGDFYKVEHIIRFLSKCENVTFIFEHTPHSNPSKVHVEQGYQWIKAIVR
jgi:sugar phosphate isomerase/epimerase